MTTIAYKDGVLAADCQRNLANGPRTVCKIRTNVGKWAAFAGAGEEWSIETCANWLTNGGKKKDQPYFTDDDHPHLILVSKEGKVFCVTGRKPTIWPLLDPFTAIGSGGDFAIGAMEAGKSAVEAVEIATKHCTKTGLGIDTWTVKARKK